MLKILGRTLEKSCVLLKVYIMLIPIIGDINLNCLVKMVPAEFLYCKFKEIFRDYKKKILFPLKLLLINYFYPLVVGCFCRHHYCGVLMVMFYFPHFFYFHPLEFLCRNELLLYCLLKVSYFNSKLFFLFLLKCR
jgi:hypothetical protein